MTGRELKKITIPLTALMIPLTGLCGWWVADQASAINKLERDVRANSTSLTAQQLEVNTSIGSLNTRHEVMAQNIEHIRETLARLEKKMDRQ